jgi:hypothetical protein
LSLLGRLALDAADTCAASNATLELADPATRAFVETLAAAYNACLAAAIVLPGAAGADANTGTYTAPVDAAREVSGALVRWVFEAAHPARSADDAKVLHSFLIDVFGAAAAGAAEAAAQCAPATRRSDSLAAVASVSSPATAGAGAVSDAVRGVLVHTVALAAAGVDRCAQAGGLSSLEGWARDGLVLQAATRCLCGGTGGPQGDSQAGTLRYAAVSPVAAAAIGRLSIAISPYFMAVCRQ